MKEIWISIRDSIVAFFTSRLLIVFLLTIAMTAGLMYRLFQLQIVDGKQYADNFSLKTQKEITIPAARGNIYDRNGELLAYNELSYSAIIEDNGTYDTREEKNATLNDVIYQLLTILEENEEEIHLEDGFDISLNKTGQLVFDLEGTQLMRFRADVYGHTTIDKLKFNDKLHYDEAMATARQVFEYLCGEKKFQISEEEYGTEMALKILSVRYRLSQNSYQKYLTTTIATELSERSVAVISENMDRLQGVSIEDTYARKYADSKYFSHLIGYTGKISQEEYDGYAEKNEAYELTDVVGKSGIEQVMEMELQGTKGKKTVYVDNMGKVLETGAVEKPTAGNDLYLTIDKNLQEIVYDIIEHEIANILLSKIINSKEYMPTESSSVSDIEIPIYEVYDALINNNVIDLSHFKAGDASDKEKEVQEKFEKKLSDSLAAIRQQLTGEKATTYENSSEELQVYYSYIVSKLTSDKILKSEMIDVTDEVYQKWKEGSISLKEYLTYAISQNWIDMTQVETKTKYSDSAEVLNRVISYLSTNLKEDSGFAKKVYRYLILEDKVTGFDICQLLFDQQILEEDEHAEKALRSRAINPFDFLTEKIKNLEITPAQLALDPCSGSCVVTDTRSGEILACVSYPGFDNNRLANSIDSEYFAALSTDLSNPFYNHATQELTAPGSTFKMVSAIAGLSENVIGIDEKIEDKGQFTDITPSPRCWIYPNGTHGSVNVTEAIRDSCNYFFYEVGYRLSGGRNDNYSEEQGLSTLKKYSQLFGLDKKSGIEIPESQPKISTELPVSSAIGQGTNSFATVQLARYVTTVANSGTCYQLSMLKQLKSSNQTVIKEYKPEIYQTIDSSTVSPLIWDRVHEGMRLVVEHLGAFDGMKNDVIVAGKTGTAQENKSRPNHALFVGYAPFEQPEIAFAVRITNGYTSANAAAVASDVVKYYYHLQEKEDILNSIIQAGEGDYVAD